MRKILLTMLAVIAGVMLSYAESCSSGQGSLSYQISGCSEQSRACCSGTWCSWGTTSCASCNDTTQACSGNVSGACAGNRTRSVTGSCGSCSYSGWNDSGCSYTQSCTATSESRNCVGNVSGVCGGTQTRTRSVTGSCGSCSYSGWGNWGGSCSYTQSCTYTDAACSSISSAYNKGDASRSVTGTCGGCSYSNWDTRNCFCDGCNINGVCENPCHANNWANYTTDCSSRSYTCYCGRTRQDSSALGSLVCRFSVGNCGIKESSNYRSLEDCESAKEDIDYLDIFYNLIWYYGSIGIIYSGNEEVTFDFATAYAEDMYDRGNTLLHSYPSECMTTVINRRTYYYFTLSYCIIAWGAS